MLWSTSFAQVEIPTRMQISNVLCFLVYVYTLCGYTHRVTKCRLWLSLSVCTVRLYVRPVQRLSACMCTGMYVCVYHQIGFCRVPMPTIVTSLCTLLRCGIAEEVALSIIFQHTCKAWIPSYSCLCMSVNLCTSSTRRYWSNWAIDFCTMSWCVLSRRCCTNGAIPLKTRSFESLLLYSCLSWRTVWRPSILLCIRLCGRALFRPVSTLETRTGDAFANVLVQCWMCVSEYVFYLRDEDRWCICEYLRACERVCGWVSVYGCEDNDDDQYVSVYMYMLL
jgi:hypothetical protein